MKVTLNWLKQYVDFNWSSEELSERLPSLGIEVGRVQKLSGEFEGIVVAQILASDKHPNADKLSVCRVNDGKSERQIVCGAKNYKVSDKVPLILPGSTLPAKPGEQPFTIKVGKIRGVESHGMMCSPKELGLAEEADGLLILPANAKVGQSFAEHLGRAAYDVVYDLEITPNRPDLISVIGVAREISAVTGNPLRIPEIKSQKSEARDIEVEPVEKLVAVRIEDAEFCPRYVARVIRGVKVGLSPDWLRQILEKVGLRTINNIVDVTNYVMLECGQPLHAFDYHLLGKRPDQPETPPTIVIRRALDGELFVTLDGKKHTLTSQALLIADETKAIALAGVMGGQNSEINSATIDVLLESACFNPQNIRATSRKLDLRTDASYRFERGADVGICDWASQRAAQLILETASGKLAVGVIDAYPQPVQPRQITLRHARVNQLLGVEIPADTQIQFLQRLNLETITEPTDSTTPHSAHRAPQSTPFRIPTFRVDLKRETDLIEEVTRLYGVDKIPATPPRGAIGANDYDAVHDELAEARRLLTGLGLFEAQGQTLIADASVKLVMNNSVALQNPLSSDMNVLRPGLLPGLLDSLRHNVSRKTADVALFEVGRVFSQTNGQPREERRMAIVLMGQRQPPFWSGEEREAKWEICDLKGLLEEFLEQFGVRGTAYLRRADSTEFYLASATVQLGKQALGELGQLQPALAKRYDLRDAVLLAELNLDLLLARRSPDKTFRALPAFPSIRRDIAMFVPEAITHEAVVSAVKQSNLQNLESLELFDVFRGKGVSAGEKSVAYAFTYRHAERTLTDEEVNATHEKLVDHLKQSLQAVVREG